MISYKDKTFCVSPNCTNQCGRKLTDEIRKAAGEVGLPLSVTYFCGSKDKKERK